MICSGAAGDAVAIQACALPGSLKCTFAWKVHQHGQVRLWYMHCHAMAADAPTCPTSGETRHNPGRSEGFVDSRDDSFVSGAPVVRRIIRGFRGPALHICISSLSSPLILLSS